MANTVFNGTNLLLKISDTDGSEANIGHTTSCSLSLSVDLPEATTKDSSGFQEVIAGVKSGEISFDGLVDYTDSQNAAELAEFLIDRTKIYFEFGTSTSGDQLISGAGYLSSLEVSAEMESPVSYSGSITITGTISYSTVA
jgi:predicted secreted protein